MKRLPAQDLLLMQQLGIDVNNIFFPKSPVPKIGSGDITKLAKVNLIDAYQEYRERVLLPSENELSVKQFHQVLAEYNEKEVAGCGEKFADVQLDAYQSQLWTRGLSVRGENAVLISSMFTEANRVLYPEYISRLLREIPMQGLGYATMDDLIAGREYINGAIAKGLKIETATGPKHFIVAEGADLPKVKITLAEETVYVRKLGCSIFVPYEVARRASMNLVGILLRRTGVEYQKDGAILAANTIYGDSGITDGQSTASSGKITMKEFIMQRRKHAHQGYKADVILYGETVDEAICQNSEVWDSRISNLMITGDLPGLGGARNLFIPETSQLSTSKLLYIETPTCLLQYIEAGSEIAEADKFIQSQAEIYTHSITTGLWNMNGAAARKYSIT